MVIGLAACVGAFCLDWFKGTSNFAEIVLGYFALGGAKQWRDVRRRELGEDPRRMYGADAPDTKEDE